MTQTQVSEMDLIVFSTIIRTGFLPSEEVLDVFEHFVIKEEKLTFDFGKLFEPVVSKLTEAAESIIDASKKLNLPDANDSSNNEDNDSDLYSNFNLSLSKISG